MYVNLTPKLLLATLFFVCFIIVYCIIRYFVYDGKITIGEYGTSKYIFTIVSIIVLSFILSIIVIFGLKLSNTVNLLDFFQEYLGNS